MLTDPGPGWFSGSRASMERLTQKIKNKNKRGLANYLENLLNGVLNIFHRSGPRDPDPYPDPITRSSSHIFLGMLVVRKVENAPVGPNNKPKVDISISQCGQM